MNAPPGPGWPLAGGGIRAIRSRRGLAHHLEMAGRDEEAAEQHVVAARQAERVYANAEAVAHYRSALALGHGEPARLHEAIADLEALRGNYAAALAAYEAAAARLSGA